MLCPIVLSPSIRLPVHQSVPPSPHPSSNRPMESCIFISNAQFPLVLGSALPQAMPQRILLCVSTRTFLCPLFSALGVFQILWLPKGGPPKASVVTFSSEA